MNPKLHARVVVLGARGMLAHDVVDCLRPTMLPEDLFAFDRTRLDVTDRREVQRILDEVRPSVVINCAAYTNVDGCETNVELARRVNALAPSGLAESCRAIGAFLVHYSTDFVFDGRGRSPYRELDPTHPLSEYGKSKLAGEHAVVACGCRHLIIRTSWLFGASGRNFVETIAGKAERGEPLRVVSDQIGRPTYSRDLAEATIRLLDIGAEGIVHFSNSGECSWHELAREVVRLSDLDVVVEAIESQELIRPAKRPAYSVLSLEKYETFTHSTPRSWQDALAAYFHTRKETASAS